MRTTIQLIGTRTTVAGMKSETASATGPVAVIGTEAKTGAKLVMCGKDINGGDYETYEEQQQRIIQRKSRQSCERTPEEEEEFWRRFQHPADR